MTTEAAMDTLRHHGSDRVTVQFWKSSSTPRSFDTLRQGLLYLGDQGGDEPLPSIEIHAADGDKAISGPELEALIRAVSAIRSST